MYKGGQGKTETRQCEFCNNDFELPVKFIKRKSARAPGKFCSRNCMGKAHTNKNSFTTQCAFCKADKVVLNSVKTKALKTGDGKNYFCNSSCAAKYNNAHKTKGTRRSKLEVYCYERIQKEYPLITLMQPNTKINGWELDLYIPNMKIGIEIQGIFHREPIYGQDKLDRTIINDALKAQMCLENNIQLYALNDKGVSFTLKNAEEFFDENILPILPINYIDGWVSLSG